jgi:hypothetical protein
VSEFEAGEDGMSDEADVSIYGLASFGCVASFEEMVWFVKKFSGTEITIQCRK